MPINNHSGAAGPRLRAATPPRMAMFMVELGWFSHRVFWHMVVRRRVRAATRAKLVAHRAVGGMGAGRARDARPPVRALPATRAPPSRTSAARSRRRCHDVAERVLAPQLLRRRELLPAERGAAALRDRRRPASCGARTTRTSRARTRTPPRRCATRSPACRPDEVAPMVGAQRGRGVRLRPRRARARRRAVGPTVEQRLQSARRDPGRLAVDRLRAARSSSPGE